MSYPQGPQYDGGYQQQQGGYPQPGGYPPQQPGYPPPYPPKKNNNALIITLAGVSAAAVIALVLVLVLSGKDDSSSTASDNKPAGAPDVEIPGPNGGGKPTGGSRPTGGGSSGDSGGPEELAKAAVDAIESRSTSQIDSLACSSTAASELKRELAKVPSGVTATVDDVKETGSTAQAKITMKLGGQSEGFTMEMRKSGSKWCISGI
ncbi:hypothetical protein ALI144C_46740 [Actinosynnema sp. ALI-1.44]|uniref:hypothetical protein n=1 Tax=Actinosynnema sp. ALI-1.44 TaxID=1933779 RepID=UPI00097C27BA|nr:hypothetical protein [Actinosynnema sp. ALI-1.44]ONI73403.1 hypothetical protein ALI144C_46740 [Actinosynnema sp. ALI-1.44]